MIRGFKNSARKSSRDQCSHVSPLKCRTGGGRSCNQLQSAGAISGIALGSRHVRQPLHGRALVVRREVRVLARNRGAFVPYNFTRDKV
jgi:hypothetical protein